MRAAGGARGSRAAGEVADVSATPTHGPPGETTISTAAAWKEEEKILEQIRAPRFAAHDFMITRFGALADGTSDASEAIRKAIAACAKAGGGRVVVPKDEFLTVPIHFQGHIQNHL